MCRAREAIGMDEKGSYYVRLLCIGGVNQGIRVLITTKALFELRNRGSTSSDAKARGRSTRR